MCRFNYTIIIPHYNSPELLDRLLNSIPNRKDLQIIVVDDCSSKETLEQLAQLNNKFPNVELFSTLTNGGGGKARNIGIQNAKGRYVLFADADDFFLPTINNLFDSNLTAEEDIIFFNAISLDSDTLLPSNRTNHLYSYFNLYTKNKVKGELAFKYLFGEPWCKLIRKELIEKNSIKFDITPIHNDTTFSYLCGHFATSIKITNLACYCLTNRFGSVSKSLTPSKQLKRIEIFAKKNKFLKTNSIKVFDPLLLNPLKEYIRNIDMKSIKKYFSICREWNLKLGDIIKGYLYMKYKF